MGTVAIEHVNSYRLDEIKKTLRKGFDALGYPKDNPLKNIVRPGDKVFIKPNWVASKWRESCDHKDSLYCVITHPAIIEAVADFVAEALCGKGEILIGDNPSIDADFEELMNFIELRHLENKYNVKTTLLDLRPMVCDNLDYYGKKELMVSKKGDPSGDIEINLGEDSLLSELEPERFRGVYDDRSETIASHTGKTQLYTFSKSIYDADVYISLPKMKCHQKVGVTLNLKGLVGSVANKNQLVHWQVGYPEIKGDEYPSKDAWIEGQTAKVKHRGAWPGNDTIWRMVVDLYRAMGMKDRRYFTVVDGIVGGEGQGPFCPTSKFANALVIGDDLLETDVVATRYMGIDPLKIKYLQYCIETNKLNINEDINVTMDGKLEGNYWEAPTNYADFKVIEQWEQVKWKKEEI